MTYFIDAVSCIIRIDPSYVNLLDFGCGRDPLVEKLYNLGANTFG
jgi:hypothetical protein